ncbi:hypothetical protein [Tistrella mobilis]|uniref:hypothetical protein n=1 Tax=Tistrella mobilis TaxID=171437 RepID=UPI003556661C
MPHLTLRTLPALLGTLPLVFMLAPARAQDPPMAVQATVAVVKPAKLDLPERDQDLIRRLTAIKWRSMPAIWGRRACWRFPPPARFMPPAATPAMW